MPLPCVVCCYDSFFSFDAVGDEIKHFVERRYQLRGGGDIGRRLQKSRVVESVFYTRPTHKLHYADSTVCRDSIRIETTLVECHSSQKSPIPTQHVGIEAEYRVVGRYIAFRYYEVEIVASAQIFIAGILQIFRIRYIGIPSIDGTIEFRSIFPHYPSLR